MSIEKSFDPEERLILTRLAATIIGPDEGRNLPGADCERIAEVILTKAAENEVRVKGALTHMRDLAEADGVIVPLAELSLKEMQALTEKHRKDLRFLINFMMIITAQSYYQDVQVLRALKLAARPPFP